MTHLFYLLGSTGKINNIEKFRHEGDQIFAIKASADRFLCFFFDGAKIIVTNAYEKKLDRMPAGEKQKALISYKNYVKRDLEGTYYEEEN